MAEEEREYWLSLYNSGVSMGYLPIGIYLKLNPGELNRYDCLQGYWFRDMIKAGYLVPSDAPKRFRDAWLLDKV